MAPELLTKKTRINTQSRQDLQRILFDGDNLTAQLSGYMLTKPSTFSVSSIIEAGGLGIYVVDPELQVRWINSQSAFWSSMRTLPEDPSQGPCHKTLFNRDAPCESCPAVKAFESGSVEHGEKIVEHNGGQLCLGLTAAPIRDQSGKDFFVVQLVRNLTQDRKIENELARIHELNMTIVENAPIAIATTDRNGVFTSVNPAFAASVGLSHEEARRKVVGRFRWLENPATVSSGLAEFIKKGLAGEPFTLKEFPYVSYLGDKNIFLDLQGIPMRGKNGTIHGLLVIGEDSTERVKMRAQLIREAKTAAMVELAMGIAHGLNNPLAAIAIHAELASDLAGRLRRRPKMIDDVQDLRSYLDVIQEEIFRCKGIVNSLLKFTTGKTLDTEEIDLKKLIGDLLKLASFNKKRVKMTKVFEKDLPVIDANLSATRQVFWNILMNAFDAVQGKAPGKVQVRAGTLSEDTVFIDIEDNGDGISDDIKAKVFEPFFTTKMPDKGSGLGLTLSEELVGKMGGTLELLRSVKGKGSTFRITLPKRGRMSGAQYGKGPRSR